MQSLLQAHSNLHVIVIKTVIEKNDNNDKGLWHEQKDDVQLMNEELGYVLEGRWTALRKRKVFSLFLKVVALWVEWINSIDWGLARSVIYVKRFTLHVPFVTSELVITLLATVTARVWTEITELVFEW